MTDDERAALVWRATADLFVGQPDRATLEKALRQVKTILAVIEPAIRADEREACAAIADKRAAFWREYVERERAEEAESLAAAIRTALATENKP